MMVLYEEGKRALEMLTEALNSVSQTNDTYFCHYDELHKTDTRKELP